MSKAVNDIGNKFNANNKEERRFFALKDLVIIAVVLLVALVSALCMHKTGGTYAELVADNRVIERIDLSQNRELTPNGYDVVLSVKDGKIAFVSSDCPDKICVRTGYIGLVGQSAVCLPNRLTLRIVTAEDDEIDTYVG
jgi:hypothetical protein